MDFLDAIEAITEPDFDVMDLSVVLEMCSEADGLPTFTPALWKQLAMAHEKDDLYRAIGEHLIRRQVPFPRPPTTDAAARQALHRLRAKPWSDILVPSGVEHVARHPYRHWTPDQVLGVIGLGSPYNIVSDHFQWRNRLRCPGWGSEPPLDLWEDPDKLLKTSWIFHSFPADRERLGVTRDDYVGTFRLRTYTATQFRPQVAKAIYGWLGAKVILDMSCGWGDRLAGFYGMPGATTYVGCDPNRAVWEMYQEQCRKYEEWTGGVPSMDLQPVAGHDAFTVRGKRTVTIVNGPAEEVPWSDLVPDGADLMFASPPYFSVERYARGTDQEGMQSWARYTEFDQWRDRFLFPVAEATSAVLREGGHAVFNLADPTFGTRRCEACDPLIDHLEGRGLTYAGVVAMAMKKRPSTQKGRGAVTMKYAEPMWVLRRGGETPPVEDGVLSLFGT
jgi:hypothetical protein